MNILIAGAGIGGLTAAVALQRAGHQVRIAERASEIKAVGAGLALAGNAMRALHSIGAGELTEQAGKPLEKAEILVPSGKVIARTNLTKPINAHTLIGRTLLRADLHQLLFNLLPVNTVYTGLTVQRFAESENGVQLIFSDGTSWQGDLLIAADGINSVIRKQLLPDGKPRFSGYTCWRGITAPIVNTDSIKFTETWGVKGRFGICPLKDNRVYWYACVNTPKENDPAYQTWTPDDLKKQFSGYHYPINELLAATDSTQVMHNDIADIVPLQQLAFGRVVLLGDAGHATTPNLGQGACQAIEDAVILPKFISDSASVEASLKAFSELRLPRTTKIVERSLLFGQIAQTDNRLLAGIRNLLMQLTPESISRKQIEFIHHVDFGS
jgi:2-polyprenyl-6-methoxyphenol hydroxylase-like FAD-dependent oxidoreductase